MVQQSRRIFLQRASLGAAAAGVAVAAPTVLSASQASAAGRQGGRVHDGPLLAYVRDPSSGDVAVMVGEREVIKHDPDLAAHLAQIAASAGEE